MRRAWIGIVVGVLAVGCAKRFIVIAPEDPTFCQRCRCIDSPPSCPAGLVLRGHTQCTLADLKPLPEVSLATPQNDAPLLRCGRFVLYREEELDYEGLFAFEAKTGALVASRTGGGYSYIVCGGGYYASYTNSPSGFVFPKRSECVAFDFDDASDGGT